MCFYAIVAVNKLELFKYYLSQALTRNKEILLYF